MFYRILRTPPGYPPDEQFMVVAYETLEFNSSFHLTTESGSKSVATLEEARRMLPMNAVRLPFERKYQFLELWKD
jgi:hypothetical protein